MTHKKLIVLAISAALFAGGNALAASPDSDSDSILVMFKPGVSKQQRESLIKHQGASLRQLDDMGRDPRMKHVAQGRIVKVLVPSGVNAETLLKKLAANPAVEVAEPNYPLKALAVPGDARFGELWGLQNTGQSGGTAGADIKATTAWDTTTGSHDVIIGIIDTGMDYNHPDLIDNRWVNSGGLPGSTYGWSAISDNGDPMDSDSHGTHVAGTIGASGDNGTGVVGVNWQVTLIPCQFLGPTGGSTAGAIECIDYFTDLKLNYGVDIKATNNSWGGGGYSEALKAAIQSAGDAGILFIAAAGNDGVDADTTPMYPAAYDLDVILSVASTDRNDSLSVFSSGASNYGAQTVDLGAPGSAILSTIPGGGYATYSGTSMASPHVTGSAALLWSVNPDLTPLEMKTILMESGDSLASLAGKTVSGKRVNLANALVDADPSPSFKLTLNPRNQQIIAGAAASYSLNIGNIADWSGEVNLSVDVSPALEGVSLSAYTAQPGDSITLLAPTTATTMWGDYQFTVTGIDEATSTITKSVNATLNVQPQGLQQDHYDNTTAITLPDNDANGISSIISVSNSGTVFGVDAAVNITHSWRGDLLVTLVSPTGTEHVLHNRTGSSEDDLVQSWQLDLFNGEQMQGDWTLTVSDNAALDTGTLNSWSLTITALPDDIDTTPVAPVADFSMEISGLNVSFSDLSTDANNDIVSWLWDFGDGNTDTAANSSHTYNNAGDYTVSLTVTDSNGLSSTASQSITLVANTILLTEHRSVRTRTGAAIVDLRWSGVVGDAVDVYRDDELIETVSNNGRYRDRFNTAQPVTRYTICLAATTNCSAEITVSF